MTTQTYIRTLYVLDCATCGMTFGIPDDFDDRRRNDHKGFYCPSGHLNIYRGKSEAEKLQDRLAAEQERTEFLRNEAQRARDARKVAERRVIAMKGVVTKTKRRIAAGKCVRCSCQFPDLAAHMAEAHPDYAEETT